MSLSIAVSEQVTVVEVEVVTFSIDIAPNSTTVDVWGVSIAASSASSMQITPYGIITESNVQGALEELADQHRRGTTAPTSNVLVGQFWYDETENKQKVYREISTNVFAWTNVVVAETDETLDAGAF